MNTQISQGILTCDNGCAKMCLDERELLRKETEMARHKATLALFEQMRAILEEAHADVYPMTVRQVFYQMVSRHGRKNSETSYESMAEHLVNARYDGAIPWEWVEDRSRESTGSYHGFADVEDYATYLRATTGRNYALDIWATQPVYVEAWVEKDALSAIFKRELAPYDIGLSVGRGYTSASTMHRVGERIKAEPHHETEHDPHARNGRPSGGAWILYWGDFDPSGNDMSRDLQDRLVELGCRAYVMRIGLKLSQVEQYRLPHDLAKKTDSRAAKHIEQYGDISVELDALPTNILRQQIREAVEWVLDMDAYQAAHAQEKRESAAIIRAVERVFDDFELTPDDERGDDDDDDDV